MQIDREKIFSELTQKFGAEWNLRWKKRLKIFAVVGIVGFFITGGLLIWAGFSAVSYIANTVNHPSTLARVETLKSEVKTLPAITLPSIIAPGCWTHAQSLLQVQPWFEKPLGDHYKNMKIACFTQAVQPSLNLEKGKTI